MDVTRRELLAGMGGLLAAAACGTQGAPSPAPAMTRPLGDALPVREDFAIPAGQSWLNSAFIHPIPIAAANAVRSYLETRTFHEPRLRSGDALAAEVKAEFAALINAGPEEISLVQSTSVAENLVVSRLGIPGGEGGVVTDALHFDGSLVLYGELAKQGVNLTIVRPRDWRIDLGDIERAVGGDTRLVAVSLVSWYNGFQHDLKAVCDVAHAKGAYVYADVIQAAGNTPIDVRSSGVDFCACSTLKWLMGDFGIGFLYVREGLLERVVQRTQIGYAEAEEMVLHYLPSDPPADTPVTWTLRTDAGGHFEVGTYAQAAVNALSVSLPWLRRLDPGKIQAFRRPLLDRLHEEMPRRGFTSITPRESPSPLIAFTMAGAEQRFAKRLASAKVAVSLYGDRMRISPSIFNDMRDIEVLLDALA